MNSSQKKGEPLWFNLNFFLQIPEYHRVGYSELFVACELQIGLEEEITEHRKTHVAYERDRILMNQPLLKNYDDATSKRGTEKKTGEEKDERFGYCHGHDNELVDKVLFGKIASEVLVPQRNKKNIFGRFRRDNSTENIIVFTKERFFLPFKDIRVKKFVKPDRLCINCRSLNWHAMDPGDFCSGATVVAGPYKLNETKRHYVENLSDKGNG